LGVSSVNESRLVVRLLGADPGGQVTSSNGGGGIERAYPGGEGGQASISAVSNTDGVDIGIEDLSGNSTHRLLHGLSLHDVPADLRESAVEEPPEGAELGGVGPWLHGVGEPKNDLHEDLGESLLNELVPTVF